MQLFVDDTRAFPKCGYECCRDADTAIFMLSAMKFDRISLDYSLGYGCKNGLDILMWMKDNHVYVPQINIHSNHILGRERMYAFCIKNFPDSRITLHMLPK